MRRIARIASIVLLLALLFEILHAYVLKDPTHTVAQYKQELYQMDHQECQLHQFFHLPYLLVFFVLLLESFEGSLSFFLRILKFDEHPPTLLKPPRALRF
ncbi:MAG: hypothetical protein C6H99_07175 [Epsilonproteobacteria bacterium]|nr:hypothetical protein [Campylobacterota bacterium]NPA63704.1 hypothetical protein [Campylobacterota bacterium]